MKQPSLSGLVVRGVIGVGALSAILGALFALKIELPLKVLITGFIALLALLITRVEDIIHQLFDLLYFIRCNYIANETQRLDPENRTPARDILAFDLKEERGMDQARRLLGGDLVTRIAWPVICTVYAVGIIIGTVFFYRIFR
jgi:hypothetical protein